VTFILGGLWHGAGWTFIFWGVLHGVFLIIHRIWNKLGFKLWTWLAWFITFNFINIAWVFFRAKEWNDAIKVLNGMIDYENIVLTKPFIYIYNNTVKKISFILPDLVASEPQKFIFDFATYFWIFLFFIIVMKTQNSFEIIDYYQIKKHHTFTLLHAISFSVLFMFSILYMSLSKHTKFIYFNF
jgi:hypothetical protein